MNPCCCTNVTGRDDAGNPIGYISRNAGCHVHGFSSLYRAEAQRLVASNSTKDAPLRRDVTVKGEPLP